MIDRFTFGAEQYLNSLIMWTVYDAHTKDFPGFIVVRPHAIIPGRSVPHLSGCLYASLEDARAEMMEMGLYCLAAEPGDEPQIVETWV